MYLTKLASMLLCRSPSLIGGRGSKVVAIWLEWGKGISRRRKGDKIEGGKRG